MSEKYKVIFPKRLKEIRVMRGLSQDRLGEMLGTTRSNIANYETGRNFPLTETLLKLTEILNTSMDYLLGNSHDPDPFLDRGVSSISIESLEDLPLSYRGESLSESQKKYLVDLLRSALNLGKND